MVLTFLTHGLHSFGREKVKLNSDTVYLETKALTSTVLIGSLPFFGNHSLILSPDWPVIFYL